MEQKLENLAKLLQNFLSPIPLQNRTQTQVRKKFWNLEEPIRDVRIFMLEHQVKFEKFWYPLGLEAEGEGRRKGKKK